MNSRLALSALSGLLAGDLAQKQRQQQDEWRRTLFEADQKYKDRSLGLRDKAYKLSVDRFAEQKRVNKFNMDQALKKPEPLDEALSRLRMLNTAERLYGAGVPFDTIHGLLTAAGINVDPNHWEASHQKAREQTITDTYNRSLAASEAQFRIWRQQNANAPNVKQYKEIVDGLKSTMGTLTKLMTDKNMDPSDPRIHSQLKAAASMIASIDKIKDPPPNLVNIRNVWASVLKSYNEDIQAKAPSGTNTPTGGKSWTPFSSEVQTFAPGGNFGTD